MKLLEDKFDLTIIPTGIESSDRSSAVRQRPYYKGRVVDPQ